MRLEFLNAGFNSAAYNMALDDVLIKRVAATKIPVLRFYGFKPTACTIGYFQSLRDEINLQKAAEMQIDCVRRHTGGGAVMHDQNQFTYSLIVPEEMVSKNILESYQQLAQGLIDGCQALGLNVEFAPLNDIVLDARKISGNAQTRRQNVVLQHGTLLLDVDVDTMFMLLKVPDEKMKDKLIKSVKKRVIGINSELETAMDFETAAEHFLEFFLKTFQISDLSYLNLDSALNTQIQECMQSKYADDAWNLQL